MLYLLGLLAHPHHLLPSTVSIYPEEAPCIPHRGALSPYSTECVEEALHTPSVGSGLLSVLDFRCPPPTWSVLHFFDLHNGTLLMMDKAIDKPPQLIRECALYRRNLPSKIAVPRSHNLLKAFFNKVPVSA